MTDTYVPDEMIEAAAVALVECYLNAPPDDRADVTRPVCNEGPGGPDACSWCGWGVFERSHEFCIPTIGGVYCSHCSEDVETHHHATCVPSTDGITCSWCGDPADIPGDDDGDHHRFCVPTNVRPGHGDD